MSVFHLIQQRKDRGRHGERRFRANRTTKPSVRTARLVSELNKFYISVPTKGSQEAEVLIGDVIP